MCLIQDNIHIVDIVSRSFAKNMGDDNHIFSEEDVRASALYGLFVAERKWIGRKRRECSFQTFASKRVRCQILDDYRDRLPLRRNSAGYPRPILVPIEKQKHNLFCPREIEEIVLSRQRQSVLKREMKDLLTEKEYEVVNQIFFLFKSREEVGESIGVHRTYVSILLSSAKDKLRKSECLYNLYKN